MRILAMVALAIFLFSCHRPDDPVDLADTDGSESPVEAIVEAPVTAVEAPEGSGSGEAAPETPEAPVEGSGAPDGSGSVDGSGEGSGG